MVLFTDEVVVERDMVDAAETMEDCVSEIDPDCSYKHHPSLLAHISPCS